MSNLLDVTEVNSTSSSDLTFTVGGTTTLVVKAGGNIAVAGSGGAVSLDVGGTGAIKPPSGTTAQRPASPATGMLRWNTTDNRFDLYTASAWGQFGEIATATSVVGKLVTTFSFSGQTSQDFTGLSGYDVIEVILVDLKVSATDDLFFQLLVGGSPITSGYDYFWQYTTNTSNGLTNVVSGGGNLRWADGNMTLTTTSYNYAILRVVNNGRSGTLEPTFELFVSGWDTVDSAGAMGQIVGRNTSTTSAVDGIRIGSVSGTVTINSGTALVFGRDLYL